MLLNRRGFVGSLFASGIGETFKASGADGMVEFKELQKVSYLSGGGKVWCFASRIDSISLSTLFVSPAGKTLMIDGGHYPDGPFLGHFLRSIGGRIDYWVLTHAHEDHMGAIQTMFADRKGNPGVEIGELIFKFPPRKWMEDTETGRKKHNDRFFGEFLGSYDAKLPRGTCAVGRKVDLGGGWNFEILNDPLMIANNSVNNSSICLTVEAGGKRWLVTGDLGIQGGNNLIAKIGLQRMGHDVVFMAHHGQCGVDRNFYAAVKPEVAIWPTPSWLWDNKLGNGTVGSGSWQTNYVKCWMQELGVKRNYLLTRDHVFV